MPRAGFLALLLALVAPVAARADEPPPAITVSGEGEVRAVPDTGQIAAGVVTEATTASEALRANSAAMQRVMAALDELGIPKKSVQTWGFSVSPVYEDHAVSRRAPRIAGYRVSNQVAVEVQGVERVGAALDRLVAAGANELGGVAFSVAEPVPLVDEARRRAMADARRRAEIYAAAAGVKLGRVLQVEETGGGSPVQIRYARTMAAEAAAPPIAAGELELSASVRVTYAIAP
jgi:hypothetical protein